MMNNLKGMLGAITQSDFILFVLLVFLLLAVLAIFFWFGRATYVLKESPSPYTGMPLRRAAEIPYSTKIKVLQYLKSLSSYDNRPFDLEKAAFCRDTGRIFPNCITWTGAVYCDWTFLQKRFSGTYVSWGSLSKAQKDHIQKAHHSLEGFQTEYSDPNPIPRMIGEEYVFYKPGPLYVDLNTNILLGWRSVPDTELEVLMVQKPVTISFLNLNQEK